MESTSHDFKRNSVHALDNEPLQSALGKIRFGFVANRAKARADLPEFEDLRDQARAIKEHTLAHLELYLEEYETKVVEAGGSVHWAPSAADARDIILEICTKANAKTVTKGKSMVGEEIAINDHLEAAGIKTIETDLGEYLIQIRKEPPSHIIAPAIHLTKDEIERDFRAAHTDLSPDRVLEEPDQFVAEARAILREQFLAADVGITGANLLVAENGSSVIVTNEGNGDLTQCLPRVHIVIASIEKTVPTLEDADTILRVLARSATGQEFSTYTTFTTGPKREGDPDGPEEFHVVILDNGRTEMLGGEFRDMLRCIRCGACMNHCPVYGAVGGHAYGWVYPGPMGSVLTPSLIGIDEAGHLPNASTFCGRCESVCPMRIPLPKMMRHWRERDFEKGNPPLTQRLALKGWAFIARRPRLYQALTGLAMPVMAKLGKRRGRFRSLPFVGGWTRHRDLAAPQGKTFQQLWRQGQ
ncbi:MAG: LutB/LldF family L-lactate oxidation iron-sulfur protein [Hyphomicrobiales bacterium]|nr:LutB/LldF family L-lactate oxidation iron-sulfur protein [Hyphomicrobiales bacterium]